MKSEVLVLGKGMLGKAFERHGYAVWGRSEFDWTPDTVGGMESVSEEFRRNFIDAIGDTKVIINCIAKSNTRWCEYPKNNEELMFVNVMLPRFLSSVCSSLGIKFVHVSTGCVYDTRGNGKCTEDGFLSSHCKYVVSKLVAESYMNDDDLIIRPRLLFDSEAVEGRNNLLQKLPMFTSFVNEFNSITSCDTLIESVGVLLEEGVSGVFNVANTGAYTIYDIAVALGLKGSMITQEDLHKSQGLFLVNNVMDTSKLEEYYPPRDTITEVVRCNLLLNHSNIF